MTVSYYTYKHYRSDFCTATAALLCAKRSATKRTSPYPVELKDNAEFYYQGFDIHISVEEAYDVETSWLGELSDQRGEDSIAHDYQNPNSFPYFNPANTINDSRQWYQQHGYSKHESHTRARGHVFEDYQTMLEIHSKGQALVTVTAFLKDTKLGTDYLDGCDWDDIEEAIIDHELVENAVYYAKQRLKVLCAAYSLSFQLEEGN